MIATNLSSFAMPGWHGRRQVFCMANVGGREDGVETVVAGMCQRLLGHSLHKVLMGLEPRWSQDWKLSALILW